MASMETERLAKMRKAMDEWQAATGAPIPAEKNPECVLK